MIPLPLVTNVRKKATVLFVTSYLFLTILGSLSANAAGKPDLAIEPGSIEIFPEETYENDQVKIILTVKNIGGADADNIGIALYVDSRDNPVDAVHIPPLSAGEEDEVTLYWIAKQEGNHTLFIFIDYEELIDEENEDNNIASIKIFVQKPIYPPFPPSKRNATWWNPEWHYRVPLSVKMFGQREGGVYDNKFVYCTINFTSLMDKISMQQPFGGFSERTFLPDSVRIIEYESENGTWKPGESVGREIILNEGYDAKENANVTLLWVLTGDVPPHEVRYYYVYWDTVENGKKQMDYPKIHSGIRNAEFENTQSLQWKNTSEPKSFLKFAEIGGWDMGYALDPVYGSDYCYKIHRKGVVWQNEWYAKIYQTFNIPDGGGANSYILHSSIHFDSDFEGVEWEILLDGSVLESGKGTTGWKKIERNVTSYLKGKSTATLTIKVEVTETIIDIESHEVTAYVDSCWIETAPNCNVTVFTNETHGWWGDVAPISTSYIAGVKNRNKIEEINVITVANPREIMASIYSPSGTFTKSSLPLPDASFESGEKYTTLYHSDVQTTTAKIESTIVHTGKKAVELNLHNHYGSIKFQDELVSPDDTAAVRQTITQAVHISHLPSLWFWYNVEPSKYYDGSVLNYTLLVTGGKNRFHTIKIGDLAKDGNWHKYEIPSNVIEKWKSKSGIVSGIEIRLIAKDEGAENIIYIDDLGYSFIPSQEGRTSWQLTDFYTFQNGTNIGNWRIDITLVDGSNYKVESTQLITVEPAPNLDVFSIVAPDIMKEGQESIISVYVKNEGPKDVEENVPINVSLTLYQGEVSSQSIKMIKAISGLKKDEIKKIDFSWRANYGDPLYNGKWTVIARVNEKGEIPEWEMTDNWNTISIDVEPVADLEVRVHEIGFSPSHPNKNDTINITTIIHNIGYNPATAEINFLIKEKGERKYTLIPGGSAEKIVGKRDFVILSVEWKAKENGTYCVKVMVDCEDEYNKGNNAAVKEIKVGGGIDTSPPFIKNIRATPQLQQLGEYLNISAIIIDNETSIDKAQVIIFNESGEFKKDVMKFMKRVGETDIYYYNTTYNAIGYYTFFIQAWDTAGDTTEWQNMGKSKEHEFRIIYEGIETNGPSIRAISAYPQRQVLYGNVNISALINDSSGIEKALIHIIFDDEEHVYEMNRIGGSKVYYYTRSYDEPGEYEYYIEAIDASANKNKNDTSSLLRHFSIPEDYDMDDVPDKVEIEAGANPKDANETINVSVGLEIGYLLWIENKGEYVYWDKENNEIRDVKKKGNLLLFDSNDDGEYDSSYNVETGEIAPYEEEVKRGIGDILWMIPTAVLFTLVCLLFILIWRK
ncbi:MAG: hypothetical protein FE048_05290 [Thermoplasmata archaeon]|nr:MAG: hypothetical protein FE048_05290 [Thermoplasmata archaeon]